MGRKRTRRIALAAAVLVILGGVAFGTYQVTGGGGSSSTPGSSRASTIQRISVSGNQLMQDGKPIRLIGVDIGTATRSCLGNQTTPFAMPADGASVTALVSWHVNTVRILVNEDCWSGLDREPHATTSSNYRKSLETFVSLLNAAHLEVILAMYSNVPVSYSVNANGKSKHPKVETFPMADAAHGETFWASVADAFRSYPGVMFDLYGEPHQMSWSCWESGCTIAGQAYVGMQQLVDAVRGTGARQPLLLGGVDYSTNLSGWLAHEPTDPLRQLVASVHMYSIGTCDNAKCWNSNIAPVAKHVPVVTGEFGATACSTVLPTEYMKWADRHSVSYVAWGWAPGTCQLYALIKNYSGSATTYGQAFQSHLLALYKAGSGNVGSPAAGAIVSGRSSKKKK